MAAYWGELAALGTALCWTFGSLVFTSAGRRIGAINLNRLRIPIAAVFLWTARFATSGEFGLAGLPSHDVWLMALSGVVGLVLGDSALFSAFVILGARRATLIMSATPIMAALIAWGILGEGLGLMAWLGIVVTLGGIAWVITERSANNQVNPHGSLSKGTILAFLGALGQALGLVIARDVLVAHRIDPLTGTLIRMLGASVTIWIVAAAQRKIVSTLQCLQHQSGRYLTIAGAFLGPFLGVWLSLISVNHIKAGIAATLMATVPIFVLLPARIFHKEQITWRGALGAAVTVGGVTLLFLR